MKRADFENQLKQSLHRHPIAMAGGEALESTILLAGKEVCRKQGRKRISFSRFLLMQMKFIGWKIWGIQAFPLVLIALIFSRPNEYLQNPLHLTKLLFCLSVLVFMTAIPFLYRCVRYRMQEVEAATRFSSVKLLMAKLILIGMGDIFLLGSIFLTAMLKTSLRADSAILYLCFPFLLAGSGSLFMLGHFSPRQFFAGSMGLCVFLPLAFSSLPGHYTFLFQQSFSGGWMAACAVLTFFCICQFRYIIYRSSYTEMQIT